MVDPSFPTLAVGPKESALTKEVKLIGDEFPLRIRWVVGINDIFQNLIFFRSPHSFRGQIHGKKA